MNNDIISGRMYSCKNKFESRFVFDHMSNLLIETVNLWGDAHLSSTLMQCMIITYLKTGEREDIENCCLRAEGPKATILNVFSFPCFEVRGNSIVS